MRKKKDRDVDDEDFEDLFLFPHRTKKELKSLPPEKICWCCGRVRSRTFDFCGGQRVRAPCPLRDTATKTGCSTLAYAKRKKLGNCKGKAVEDIIENFVSAFKDLSIEDKNKILRRLKQCRPKQERNVLKS